MKRGGQVVHGHAKDRRSSTYRSWAAMLTRCYNSNCQGYACYGGRGIKVCRRWHVFENFLSDMGERLAGTTIDRWPNADGMYEPGNARWATKKEQAHNRRSFKITCDIAQEILGRFEHGESRRSIAERLKLSKSRVTQICNGRAWPELDRPWTHQNDHGLVIGRGTHKRKRVSASSAQGAG